MKRLIILSLGILVCFIEVGAQMIIPEFSEPTLIKSLSSSDEESMPLPFNNGTGFYFMRRYYGGPESNEVKGEDIWISEQKKKGWENPYRLFRVDDIEGSGSIIGVSQDGNRVYLLVTKYMETSTQRKIGFMDKTGKNSWSSFTEIKIEGFKFEEKFYHFYMTKGEKILLISMSPATNQLNEDLYVSLKKDGKWAKPIDLGETINTSKIELAPYMEEDGTTLYFSSEGHEGLGESDIFVSRRMDETWTNWTKPANLGAPINSEGFDDYFIIGNNSKVFFTSSRGEQENSSIYEAIATGSFRYAISDSILGQFIYKGLPADNVTIEIYDLEDNLLVELVTDEEGKFVYKKLSPEQNFMVKIKEEDGDEFIGSKMYLSDSKGKRYKRLIYTKVGMFVEGNMVKETEEIFGVFNYNSLPMSSSALVLYDENGFPVDTIYTDEFGRFNYNKIAYDKNFTLVPLVEADDFSMVDLYLTDNEGNRTFTLASKNDKFAFIPAGNVKGEVAMAPAIEKETRESSPVAKTGSIVNRWNGMSDSEKTVYFEFASNTVNGSSQKVLQKMLAMLKEDPSVKVSLIGHTDSVGSEESNQSRGVDRAEAVKEYLLKNGLKSSSIESVNSNGELKPIASNSTASGRAKNRRVEITLK